jgi:hypothetical protein
MQLGKQTAAVLIVILSFLSLSFVRAQSVNSSIQGIATDSTGAAVPAADVSLTNINTGIVLKAKTGDAGTYSFPSIPLGLYNLTVSKQGFATYAISNFNVIVGQHATQNVTLVVAGTMQVVTVNAGDLANLLQPESNDLGTVISPEIVSNIPLNGRNYLQLGLISGATQQATGAAAGSVGQTGSSNTNGNRLLSLLIAGNEPDYSMYLVNGIQTVGSRSGNSSLNLSVSAIDQFEVHYGFFMPDLGPNPGIVDVITKTGTNQFHGEVYEFFRNTALEASDYFAGKPAPYHQNQFGGSFGGPILKNRLFFFGNYEGYREVQSSVQTGLVPTQAEFGGDFSALPTQLYNPFSIDPATGLRNPFPLNQIPTTLFNPTAQALLAYYLPGSTTVTNNTNISAYPTFTQYSDQYTGRIDYNLNQRNQIFGQGTYLNSPENSPGLFPGRGAAYPLNTELAALGWTSTLSQSKVNELRIGWTRNSVYTQGDEVPGLQTKLGITGTDDINGVPGIGLVGYARFGESLGLLGDVDNSYQIHDAFNWLLGKHMIKFGADIAYVRTVDSSANATARGSLSFQGNFTAQLAAAGTNSTVAGTGNSFADFLLGIPANGEAKGMPLTHYRWTTAQPYLEDTWKVTPKFTANLAIAWYGTTPPNPAGNNKNYIHGFDFNTGLETFAALGQVNPEVYPMTMTNWAPRIGGSYQIDKNTVIRGGWGLYYTTQMALNVQYSVVSNVITVNNAVNNTISNPTYFLGTNIFGPTTVGQITQAEANAITGPMQYLSETQRSPYIYQYNLDIEHTFGPYLFDVAYVGNASHRLAVNYNPFDCSAPDFTCSTSRIPYGDRYPYMQEVDSIGWGNYNGLIAKFQRQFIDGLGIIVNYTWSKALAAAQEGGISTLNQMKSCFQCDYGMTTFNVPQSLSVSAVWNIPIGRDRQFGRNMNRALDAIVGGWNLDAIGSFQKGIPINMSEPNRTDWPADNTRPDRFCNGHSELANKNLRSNGLRWLVPARTSTNPSGCFEVSQNSGLSGTASAPRDFGDTKLDPLTGPGIDNYDLAVHKNFKLYKKFVFDLQGEFFNAFNHTDFANPDSGVADTNFGLVTSDQHQPRIIQIAGTLTF